MDRRLAHVTSFEPRPHLVLVCVGIYAFGILIYEPLWRRTITGLPAPVWVPAAPTHTPPTHTRSRHPRWSSSGIPRTSSPSFPQRGVPSPDTPPCHHAPGSLHATARKKTTGFMNRIRSSSLKDIRQIMFATVMRHQPCTIIQGKGRHTCTVTAVVMAS